MYWKKNFSPSSPVTHNREGKRASGSGVCKASIPFFFSFFHFFQFISSSVFDQIEIFVLIGGFLFSLPKNFGFTFYFSN